jgi:Tfp pilus assembly protein PilZ
LESTFVNMRKEKRIEERNTVVIRSAGNPNGPHTSLGVNAYTYDLSLGGTRLFADRPFAVGDTIRIVIELAKTCQTIQVDGEVKWTKRNDADDVYEIGVEFLHNISQTILSLIRHLYGMGNGISASVVPGAAVEREAGVGHDPGSSRHKKRKNAPGGAAGGQTGTPRS